MLFIIQETSARAICPNRVPDNFCDRRGRKCSITLSYLRKKISSGKRSSVWKGKLFIHRADYRTVIM